jgi:Zn-dependent protease with chaperone function
LQLQGDALHIGSDSIQKSIPLAQVQWPERTRHGKRVAHFTEGGSVQCADADAWDAWSHSSGKQESWIVMAQQSWRGVVASIAGLLALAVALHLWGLPLGARAVVALTPMTVDASLGEAALVAIDQQLMKPTKLAPEEQARLRSAFVRSLSTLPPASLPQWKLEFRSSVIGPNAFALPGGTMVMTDELVELVGGDAQIISAVLAHELGHVQHRHGLRMLVQATVLGALGAAVLGDFSTLLAAVPALLGQAHYSRAAEREADAYAVKVLKAAAISPTVMVTLFEKLQQQRNAQSKDTTNAQDSWLGIAFASHPSDAERIKYFRDAAQ